MTAQNDQIDQDAMRRLFGHDDDDEDSPFTLAEVAIAVWKQDPDRLIQIIEKRGNSTQWNHELQAYVSGFDFTMMNEVL